MRPHRSLATLLVGLAVACLFGSARPATAAPKVPEPLQPWVPWVLHGKEGLGCPSVDGERVCAWPGRLELDLAGEGGTLDLQLRADEPLSLPLPGDAAHWPAEVRVDGQPATLVRRGERPHVQVPAGEHRVSARFTWLRLPESLPVPPSYALLSLSVDGRAVARPRRQGDGLLWLQGGPVEEVAERDALALEVHRRIDDGVPVVLTTRLQLRVAGRAREITLPRPLPEGFEATELTSPLPVRLERGGDLQVQLRPGDWTVVLTARSSAPLTALGRPQAGEPWPDEEIWVWQPAAAVRAVQVTRAPGVDPNRTSLPAEWRGLSAYRLARAGSLQFEELRRGEAEPPPDRVEVQRSIWLRPEGGGLLVRDRLSGQLHEGGRLELEQPGALGSVQLGGEGQVVTRAAGDPGVEVRRKQLELQATLTYPDRRALPAVGWNRDASSLSATVQLPPGWRLLAVSGADRARGTWIDAWTLLDLFGLLLVVVVSGRRLGWLWGAVAGLGLLLAWHEPGAPRLLWLVLLGVGALLGALKEGRLATATAWLRRGLVALLVLQLVVFGWGELRTGLFPQLDQGGRGPQDSPMTTSVNNQFFEADMLQQELAEEESWDAPAQAAPKGRMRSERGLLDSYGGASGKVVAKKRAKQIDPQAVVQTGPGVPQWTWRSHQLSWGGPVGATHRLRLWLVPPWLECLFSLLRVGLLSMLAWRLADPRQAPSPRAPTAPAPASALTALVLAALASPALAPISAHAEEPSPPAEGVLDELERRLTAPPACAPECVELVDLQLRAGAELSLLLEAHAEADAALALPGPADAWVPRIVLLDGKASSALRRRADGVVLLRLPEGRHTVELRGPAPDVVALQLPLRPRRMDLQLDGWTATGWRPDAPPPASLQLARAEQLRREEGAPNAQELAPFLELRRELDLGIPWLINHRLVRRGPARGAVHVAIPLLAGESVTTPGIEVQDGLAQVTLQAGEGSVAWSSTLADSDSIELVAESSSRWNERWELACSPIFRCSAEGIAPIRHMHEGRWSPAWLPWPGERVTLTLSRPAAVEGATTTVDSAVLDVRPGRRVRESRLTLQLRSSQGGEQTLTLPPGAKLDSFTLDGSDLPVQAKAGKVGWSLPPGNHTVDVSFREDHATERLERAPAVDLGLPSANVRVMVAVPDHEWLLGVSGPRWGPVVTWWHGVLVLAVLAMLLGRFAPTSLRSWQWFLLGLGMTQVEVIAPLVVIGWLVALGLRRRHDLESPGLHNLVQLGLIGWSLLAMAMLFWAVSEGLLVQPDMQVRGAGSSSFRLVWYAAHADGALPRPAVLWLPLWTWKAFMLAWALWLASSVFRWVVEGWQSLTAFGLFRGVSAPRPEAPPSPPKWTPKSRSAEAAGGDATQDDETAPPTSAEAGDDELEATLRAAPGTPPEDDGDP